MTPYYDDGQVTLYHGDCGDVLPTLGLFDLVVTSAPYNLGTNPGRPFGHWRDGNNRGGMTSWKGGVGDSGIGYADHDDAMPYPAYRAWQQAVLTECWQHLTPAGAIFYVHKPRVQRDGLWLPLDLNPGLPVRQIVIWNRGSGFNHTPTAFTPQHEWIIVIAPEAFRVRAGAYGDVWRIAPEPSTHPAPFPVALPARAIDATAATSVLDPFAGSGSTLVAAKEAGVRAVGIEKSERYCELAARRVSQGVLDFAGRDADARDAAVDVNTGGLL